MDRPIRILYDEIGFREPFGGVSRYFTELVKNLPAGISGRFSAKYSRNVYLQANPFNLPRGEQDVNDFIRGFLHGHLFPGVSHVYAVLARLFPNKFPSIELANRRAFAAAVKKGDFDILHITDPHPHFEWWKPVLGKKPIVATIHDLIPDMLQGNKRVAIMRRRLVEDASHIIAISQNTKRDLVRLYGVDEKKVTVIYHGYSTTDSAFLPFEQLSVRPRTRKYILFVGKRGGYKNFGLFISAVAPLLKSDSKLSVFCTGSAFSNNEKALIERMGVTESITQGFVRDAELPSVFANAAAFVYPSQYEGFGIPILDAFAAGCPVVLSNTSCFPEVAGDAALYFTDGDAEGLRAAVAKVLGDYTVRKRLLEKGKNRILDFSWRKCAEQTGFVYKLCASH